MQTVPNPNGKYIEYPDEFDFDNPDIDKVHKTLTKEIIEYDGKYRNVMLEELHGVNCLCPEETPEMVAKALSDLDREIECRIPPSEKQSYLRARRNPNSYVHSREFRLKFLRTSVFEIPLVADRLVRFLNLAEELFGEQVLHRGVRLSDFTKKDMQLLRLGRFQFMPFGDRIGRRILVIFIDDVWESFSAIQKV